MAADNIRILALSMVEKANSGHPGGAMGGADFVNILYSEFLRYDPQNTAWPWRDRFFLDPGHMSPMLYAVLGMAGYYSLEELENFRRWGSITPGHPERDLAHMVENTSGPLGQGHAMALGAAICSVGEVSAQFSMGAIGKDAVNPGVVIPLELNEVDVSVINDAQARVMRKAEWNRRNSVDFRTSLTGMVTQFNKSWAKDNQNSVSSELSVNYTHVYSKDKYTMTFKFYGIYGVNFIDDAWFKNQDKLELSHLSSWKVREKGLLRNWAYSVETKFWSQFAEGFKSRTEHDPWSNFMAPGTFNVGLGLTYYSPNKKLPFEVTLNPLSGDALFVLDKRLPDDRKMKLGLPDIRRDDGSLVTHKMQGGSSLTVNFKRTFNLSKSVTLQYISDLSSFYGWITQVSRKGEQAELPEIMPTALWTNRFIINPLKFLSLEFRATTRYDKSQVDRVQMQYYLRVGLTYGYKNR